MCASYSVKSSPSKALLPALTVQSAHRQAPGLAVQYSYTFNLGTPAEKAKLVKDWQAFIAQENLTWKFYSNMVVFDGQIILEGLYCGSKEEYDALGLEQRFPPSEAGNVLILTDWLGMVGHELEDTILRLVGNTPTWFYAKFLGFNIYVFSIQDYEV